MFRFKVFGLIVAVSMLLAACAPAATPSRCPRSKSLDLS